MCECIIAVEVAATDFAFNLSNENPNLMKVCQLFILCFMHQHISHPVQKKQKTKHTHTKKSIYEWSLEITCFLW